MRLCIVLSFMVMIYLGSPIIVTWYYVFSDQATNECIDGMEYIHSWNSEVKQLRIRDDGGVFYCKKGS